MSWPLVKLGTLVAIKTGRLDANAADDEGTYPFFTCSRDPLRINTHAFDCDAILIAGNGDLNVKHYSGKFNAYQRTYVVTSLSDEILDTRYLFYFMDKYVERLRELSIGGVIKYIKLGMLTDAEIPFPPLPEQKRIAAILAKTDAIRRKRQQAIQLADDFLRAVFLDMFGDPVTNPKGWEVKAIKEMAVVTTGNTPPRDNIEYYGDFIEWIKSDNINTPSDYLTEAAEYLSEAGYTAGRHVAAGSTLLTCIAGSFDCIGNAAYTDREVAFNQQINALTPKTGVNGLFLYALAKYCKKTIQAASTGGMKGMVSKGKLEEVRFICPPESLQQSFAEAFYRYQGVRKGMEHSLSELNDGFSSISQKAFSGQL